MKIEFTGPTFIEEDVMGYIGVIDELNIVVTGKTKIDVLNECLTSLKVLLAYNSGIDI